MWLPHWFSCAVTLFPLLSLSSFVSAITCALRLLHERFYAFWSLFFQWHLHLQHLWAAHRCYQTLCRKYHLELIQLAIFLLLHSLDLIWPFRQKYLIRLPTFSPSCFSFFPVIISRQTLEFDLDFWFISFWRSPQKQENQTTLLGFFVCFWLDSFKCSRISEYFLNFRDSQKW